MFRKRIPAEPTRPADFVATGDLIQDLLIALAEVVGSETSLARQSNGKNGYHNNGHEHHDEEKPELEKLRLAINRVVTLHNKLAARGADFDETLQEACVQTGLNLRRLLDDCLNFPTVFPYTRNLDGLRKSFLCYCNKKETVDQEGLRICPDCMHAMIECLKEKKKDDRFILYSSYSPQVRCRHADFKTLLITFNKPGLWMPAWCLICLQQEETRMRKAFGEN